MDFKKLSNKTLLLSLVFLIIINSILIILLTKTQGVYNLDGSYSPANSAVLIFSALIGLLILFPILIFIISVIISAFALKTKPFGERLIRVFLWCLCIFYSITGIVYLINFLVN